MNKYLDRVKSAKSWDEIIKELETVAAEAKKPENSKNYGKAVSSLRVAGTTKKKASD